MIGDRWMYFTYRMTCSVNRSGLIAFSQRAACMLGWRKVASFELLVINVLKDVETYVTAYIFTSYIFTPKNTNKKHHKKNHRFKKQLN